MLRLFMLLIAECDDIDVRQSLVTLLKKHGANAFDFNQQAFEGKVKGMWTHADMRPTDKPDLFPQPNLIDMYSACSISTKAFPPMAMRHSFI